MVLVPEIAGKHKINAGAGKANLAQPEEIVAIGFPRAAECANRSRQLMGSE
jgi:hypothetical protein